MRLLAALLVLAACRAAEVDGAPHFVASDDVGEVELATTFVDRTPARARGALDGTILIYHEGARTLASGSVLGPDTVLTCAHVVDDLPRDAAGGIVLELEGITSRVTVAAFGDTGAAHGDWAVLRLDQPRDWRAAPVHAPALDPDWSPAIGQEVLLAGYAAGFFPERDADVHAPTPSVPVTVVVTDDDLPSWYASGDALHLGGMSGGGAYVWNPARGRAELIGVFPGYTFTTVTEVTTTRFLGFPIGRSSALVPGVAYMVHRVPVQQLRGRHTFD